MLTQLTPNQQAITTGSVGNQALQDIFTAITASDPAGLAATNTITIKAPALEDGSNTTYTTTGAITGPNNAGVTVSFSGFPDVDGKTTKTGPDGDFALLFIGKNLPIAPCLTAQATVSGVLLDTWVAFQ